MTESKEVSVVGLGLLGGALARRLLNQGWRVRGFDLDPEAATRFSEAGGTRSRSLAECVEDSPRIVLSLPDSQVVQSVLEPILLICRNHSSRTGIVILDTTTGEPDVMARNAELSRVQEIGYLDACIGGSSQEAERGEAILMVGGDPLHVERARALLDALASRVFPLDRPGDGARMKLVTNLVLGLTRGALAEGMSFAEGLGLDLRTTLEVLEAGPARSHAMKVKGKQMIERDFKPRARLAQHLKDVRLIVEAARQAGRPVPFTVTHEKILNLCIQEGWGDLDNSAVLLGYYSEKITKLE